MQATVHIGGCVSNERKAGDVLKIAITKIYMSGLENLTSF